MEVPVAICLSRYEFGSFPHMTALLTEQQTTQKAFIKTSS